MASAASDAVFWMFLGAVLCKVGLDVAAIVRLRRQRPEPISTPPIVPTPASDSPWHAMPGSRLELGASGFSIEPVSRPSRFTYRLYSPEGALCAHGGDLAALKQYGEQLARDRDQFKPPPPTTLTFTRK